MSLSFEYYLLIATATYTWVFVPLVAHFMFEIEGLDWDHKQIYRDKDYFWILSIPALAIMLLI